MPDPLRSIYIWPGSTGRPLFPAQNTREIVYHDNLRRAAYLIAKYELRVWFEPNWRDARMLARRFPHCLICSIPEESDTPSLHRVPGWRKCPRKSVL